jgi:ATP-dependent Lon protease
MNLPEAIAVMTLPGATLFPQSMMPLFIFEPRYRRMLADMLDSHRMFSVAMQKPDKMRESPCPVAGLGLIRASVSHKDGTSHLVLQGLTRVELGTAIQTRPYRIHPIRALPTPAADGVTVDALVSKVHELVDERLRLAPAPLPFALIDSSQANGAVSGGKSGGISIRDVLRYLQSLPGPDQLADLVASALLPEGDQRQAILETVPIEERLRSLIRFLLGDIIAHRNLA